MIIDPWVVLADAGDQPGVAIEINQLTWNKSAANPPCNTGFCLTRLKKPGSSTATEDRFKAYSELDRYRDFWSRVQLALGILLQSHPESSA